jgi:hypothetical protein
MTNESKEEVPQDRLIARRTPTFEWMTTTDTEWGIRARPGEKGLRLADINIGSYGEVPDTWPYDTEIARGSQPNEMAEGMGYSIFDKHEVWAPSAAELYEDSIQGRWAPATDIPWETLTPLPKPLEAAVCQLCTDLSQRSYVAMTSISGWLQHISYGFLEVKSYLATHIFELARHSEVFRKRALANGGGLGIEPPNHFAQRVMEALNFTEAIVAIDVLDAVFREVLFARGDDLAQSEAEREIYRRCLADTRRHLQYGLEHLVWVLEHRPDRRVEMQRYLRKAEQALVQDMEHPLTEEPLIVLLGGGLDGIETGRERLRELRRAQTERYLDVLREAGLAHDDFRLHSHLAAFVADETAAPA